jgi:selenocysteine-specific elongation factor
VTDRGGPFARRNPAVTDREAPFTRRDRGVTDRDAPLTVGTAGHIDHGKSALVEALTGARTDRLPEERARGMTIALGYSRLRLPSGRALSMIDVPGHERLVRVMVAGAGGIDLFLLAVAADDGVMPQTVEHARILQALEVRDGVVVVTKADLADPARAIREAQELVPGARVRACSTRTGEGLEEVLAALELAAAETPTRAELAGGCVLHVDRVFSIRGAGTVLTGTLWSGSVAPGERLQLLPSGEQVRVRGVQVHDEAVECARAGQRVAVNLSGVARERVSRGDVLASLDTALRQTFRVDARLRLSREPSAGERVQVHHGTRESPARLVRLGGEHWQVRLEQPLLAAAEDHLVIRRISVPDTLGGGVIVDPAPRRHGPSAQILERLERGQLAESAQTAAGGAGQAPPAPASGAAERTGAAADGGEARASAWPLSAAALALEQRLRDAGVRPLSEAELGAEVRHLAELRRAGRIRRVGRSMHAHVEALERVQAAVEAIVASEGAVTLARLRDELAISRRYAQALLEHLDAARVTRRLADDSRVLRRRLRP